MFYLTIRSGQVRSEYLTCTFRASCLRRFLYPGQETKGGGGGSKGWPALAGTREYKQSDRGR